MIYGLVSRRGFPSVTDRILHRTIESTWPQKMEGDSRFVTLRSFTTWKLYLPHHCKEIKGRETVLPKLTIFDYRHISCRLTTKCKSILQRTVPPEILSVSLHLSPPWTVHIHQCSQRLSEWRQWYNERHCLYRKYLTKPILEAFRVRLFSKAIKLSNCVRDILVTISITAAEERKHSNALRDEMVVTWRDSLPPSDRSRNQMYLIRGDKIIDSHNPVGKFYVKEENQDENYQESGYCSRFGETSSLLPPSCPMHAEKDVSSGTHNRTVSSSVVLTGKNGTTSGYGNLASGSSVSTVQNGAGCTEQLHRTSQALAECTNDRELHGDEGTVKQASHKLYPVQEAAPPHSSDIVVLVPTVPNWAGLVIGSDSWKHRLTGSCNPNLSSPSKSRRNTEDASAVYPTATAVGQTKPHKWIKALERVETGHTILISFQLQMEVHNNDLILQAVKIGRDELQLPSCYPCFCCRSVAEPFASAISCECTSSSNSPQISPVPVTNRDILKALRYHLNAKWLRFGICLGVDNSFLKAIEIERRGKPDDCMLELVSRWTANEAGTGTLPRTWQTVVEAVNDTGYGAFAQDLAKRHRVHLS